MIKTLTCRELGGICDEPFSGEVFMDIVNQASAHMMADKAHLDVIMEMEKRTGETKDQWMERMQKVFDAKSEV